MNEQKLKIIGNKNTKEFHIAEFSSGSCNLAEITDGEEFDTFEDAIAAGLEGCGHCMAHVDKRKADEDC